MSHLDAIHKNNPWASTTGSNNTVCKDWRARFAINAAAKYPSNYIEQLLNSSSRDYKAPIVGTNIDVCDIVTHKDHRDFCSNKITKWRVDSHLKRVTHNSNRTFEETNPFLSLGGILDDILFDSSCLCGPDKVRLVRCCKEEAEYISVVGVSGAILRALECKRLGVVQWSQELINQERESAKRHYGHIIF